MSELETGALAPAAPVNEPSPGTQPVPAPDTPAVGEAQAEVEKEPAQQPRTYTEEENRKIVSERLAKERRRLEKQIRAELERDHYKQQLEARQQPQDQPKGKPQPKDFESPEAYVEALADWKLEQKLSDREKKALEEQKARQARERTGSLLQAITKGSEEFEDFQEVVFGDAGSGPISEPMAIAIAESKSPAKLAYYLRSNPREAERIADLPSTLQAFEVHSLASKLAAAPKPSSAPPPIVPNSGNAAPKSGYRPDMSDKEFAEWRRRQKAQRA